jgi:hypothetical protein
MIDRSPETLALIYEVLRKVPQDVVQALEQRLELLFDELAEQAIQPDLPLDDEELQRIFALFEGR